MKPHIPVMLAEVMHYLNPQKSGVYVDATFGAGGYTAAILESAECVVHALDRDESVTRFSSVISERFGSRFNLHISPFSNMSNYVSDVDGVVFDLGVSSMQLDEAHRGFSFNKDAPLDMRMGLCGRSARDFVNDLSESEMADFIYKFGEEKNSRKIAKAIVEYRTNKTIETTGELSALIEQTTGRHFSVKIHPATRTFQAIRIWVNEELEQLSEGLQSAYESLKNNGVLVCVSFHSLEDRMVKQFINSKAQVESGYNRHLPQTSVAPAVEGLRAITKGAIMVSDAESSSNPRSRSARLRAAIKVGV